MGTIYFAECDGRIKIGFTKRLDQRLRDLRDVNGQRVTLIAALKGEQAVEFALHAKLQLHKLGKEWYRDCDEVRAAIQNSINNFGGEGPVEKRPEINDKFGIVARALWPQATSFHLARRMGVTERNAHQIITGTRRISARAVVAIINEIC